MTEKKMMTRALRVLAIALAASLLITATTA
jgi:hypothetical protein